MRLSFLALFCSKCSGGRHACGNQSGRKDCRTLPRGRDWREVRIHPSTLAKLLECACLFWRFFARSAQAEGTLAATKAAEKTAALSREGGTGARVGYTPRPSHRFWNAPVFSGAFLLEVLRRKARLRQPKRQKRLPHSPARAGLARGSHTPLDSSKAFGVRLSFLALFCSKCSGGRHACGNQSGRKDCRT